MSFMNSLFRRNATSGASLMGGGRAWAVVTGASQGLGLALCNECARRGMNLILVALPGQGLEQTAYAISERYNVRTAFYETDLTAPGGAEALAQWIWDVGYDIAVLINNAGVGYNRRFEDSTLRENEACILLNNLALVKLTRLMLPQLRRHPQAHILNVASMAAFFPMPFMPVYAPSKAFILNFSLALRAELAGSPVNVSVLCPNGVRTNQDAIAKIEQGGLAARLTCMDPDQVTAAAIRGMLARKAVIVPGWLNQCIVAMSRFIPHAAIYGVISLFWGRTARPASA